ncbi:MAG: DegV family protein [Faecousia sp.]
MNVRIIVDSTADVSPWIRERLTVVPLTVYFGDEEYLDGVTITRREFYEKLIESDVLPHTSQATPDVFAQVFAQVADRGEKAVVITISSRLSGTYQSAVIAAQDYPEQIYVVDSQSVATGAGILAELALRLADGGMEAKDIAAQLTQQREDVCLIALLDTLEYLKRGGRISKAVAFAGGMLSIKPVITMRDGELVMLGKARGSRQGNNLLVRQIEAAGGVDYDMPVLLGYTGLSDVLLQKYVADSAFLWEGKVEDLQMTQVGSVVGTHAGPGAIVATFFRARH